MELGIKTSLKQTGRLALTQQLVQSIEMLQLSNLELAEKISSELIENPVLEEENTELQMSPDDDKENDKELLSDVSKELSGDDLYFQKREDINTVYEETGSTTSYDASDGDRKRSFIENAVAQQETLNEHLNNQAMLLAKNESEFSLLQSIITSLDDNGFLNTIPEEIAESESIDVKTVREAIGIINNLDPIGCGAKNVNESLIIQAMNVYPDDPVLLKILQEHFIDLEKLEYQKIASALNISTAEVIRKSRLIQNLNPFPGLKYSPKKTRYIIPDIEIGIVDGEVIVTINDEWIPKIRISSYYKNILKQRSIDKKLVEYLRAKIQSASNLLSGISNRRNTITKVVNAIMRHQRDFLIKGVGNLKPLVYADIAMEVGMHESTISRVANNKFAQTPWGVFELKYFFVSKLKSQNDVDHSSEEVMSLIKEIIGGEDPLNPVSDEEILQKLQTRNINISRRTITKYRSALNILSSNMRKKFNLIKSGDSK
jgi:RNA polymerase sigma-54 factor